MDAIIPIGTVIGWLAIVWVVINAPRRRRANPRPRAPHDGQSAAASNATSAGGGLAGVKSGASSEHIQL